LKLLKHRGPIYLFEKGSEFAKQTVRQLADRLWRPVGTYSHSKGPARLSPQQAAAEAWKRMEERYVARPDTGSGILFRPYRSAQQADWTSLRAGNQYNGWDRFLVGGVEVVELPGGHSTMCEEPHVRILAKRLTAAVDLALAPARTSMSAFAPADETLTSMTPRVEA
jgi:thioesterase domain-containing protein